jgi:hypothetical protein
MGPPPIASYLTVTRLSALERQRTQVRQQRTFAQAMRKDASPLLIMLVYKPPMPPKCISSLSLRRPWLPGEEVSHTNNSHRHRHFVVFHLVSAFSPFHRSINIFTIDFVFLQRAKQRYQIFAEESRMIAGNTANQDVLLIQESLRSASE